MTVIQIICLVVVACLAILGGILLVKKSKKNNVLRWIALIALTAILVCSIIFWKTNFELMSSIIVIYFAILAGYFILTRSTNHSLVKLISLFILISLAFTWIFAYGYFNGAEYASYGMNQQGLTDIPNLLYYSINFAGDKIIFLLALGAFYAVLNRSEGYKKLVNTIASKFEGKELAFALFTSLILTLMTTILSQTFTVLIFVPFIVSILLNMKLDRLSAFAITFGSILVGNLGLIYGGEGLYWFNYYTQITIKNAMIYRLILLVVGYILFNVFTIIHAKKVLNDKKLNEIESDPFKVEKFDKNAKSWPISLLFILLFILVILGYINWKANFNINAFASFHEWLFGLTIGEFAIFKVLLGSLATEFGAWNLFNAITMLVLFSILIAFVSRIKFNDFLESYGDGFKKMAKPILLFVGTYMVMVAAYQSPFVPTITNMLLKNATTFNPFLTSIVSVISNIFHVDFGFTGYAVATYLTTTYSTNIDIIHIIFTSINGYLGLFVPTSAVLLIGLSYLDIDYKSWMKYIWIFLLAMLVVILILIAILA